MFAKIRFVYSRHRLHEHIPHHFGYCLYTNLKFKYTLFIFSIFLLWCGCVLVYPQLYKHNKRIPEHSYYSLCVQQQFRNQKAIHFYSNYLILTLIRWLKKHYCLFFFNSFLFISLWYVPPFIPFLYMASGYATNFL